MLEIALPNPAEGRGRKVKKVFISIGMIVLLLNLLCLNVLPVLASDNTTNVDVSVVSGGDVDASINLQGDNLNVEVNGDGLIGSTQFGQAVSGLSETIGNLDSALQKLIKDYQTTNNKDNYYLTLHDAAIAKLITEITSQISSLNRLNNQVANLDKTASDKDTILEQEIANLSKSINSTIDSISQLTNEDIDTRSYIGNEIMALRGELGRVQNSLEDELNQSVKTSTILIGLLGVATILISYLLARFLIPRK